jgi:hypothetical protein
MKEKVRIKKYEGNFRDEGRSECVSTKKEANAQRSTLKSDLAERKSNQESRQSGLELRDQRQRR